MKRNTRFGVCVAVSLFAAGAGRAVAQTAAKEELSLPFEGQLSSKYKIDDANPEASVPSEKERNNNPLEFGYYLQDLIARSEEAKKRHDNAALIRYYRAITVAVPDRAKAWSDLCRTYQLINETDKALNACRYAIARPGSQVDDFVRFVSLTVSKPGELSVEARGELKEVLAHLSKEQVKTPSIAGARSYLQCQIGAKTKDIALLEECTATLSKLAPDDPNTVVFKWSLAVQKGQMKEADRLISRAKELGVVPENIERMETVTGSSGLLRKFGFAGGALLMGAAGWALWNGRRRRAVAR